MYVNILLLSNYQFVVAAFAPAARVQRSALKMSFETELGAQPPLGFWDPLGLSNGASQEKFDNYRFAELKVGEVNITSLIIPLSTYIHPLISNCLLSTYKTN